MQRPSFITTEKNDSVIQPSALIVDKAGIIGGALAKKLSEELLVVYVNARFNSYLDSLSNIVRVPCGTQFPVIPKHYYSYIFIIDDGTKITREALPKFIEQAEKDNSLLFFAVHISDINEKLISKIVNNPRIAKIIIYGDIFSNEKIHDYKTSQFIVNKFIQHARRFGKIEVVGDGLQKTYPLFLDDAIDAILEIVFSSHDLSSIFYLFPKHPSTQISLAHMIQKASPNVRIDFVQERSKEKENIALPSSGKYLLNDNYRLDERIRKIFIEGHKNLYATDEENKYFEVKKNNHSFLPLFALLYLIFLMLLPLIATLFFSFLGVKTLNAAKEEVDRGKLINAQKLLNASSTYFYLAKKTSEPLLIEASAIGRKSSLESIVRNIGLGEDISRVGLYFIESLNKYSLVFMNKSKNPKSDFVQAGTLLKNSMVLLQKIQAEDKLPLSLSAAILNFDPLIKFAAGGIDILPNIFGFTGAKTYLILFQNNMELRPAGGFIGSYGLLTLDAGIVKDFSVHDVYDADNKLKGHVEPPYPIRRYLPIKHWYLRDSNFDIDFVKSASKSAFFLNIETGKEANGIVGIDVSFARNLVSAMGKVYLADYKETVDKNNFFELTESYAKKDFLRLLFSAILLDISSRKNLAYISLARVISDSLSQKHLLFAFASPTIQDFFTLNNWSSTFWDKRVEQDTTINDFIGINEANLGANNANYLIKRKVSYNIGIDSKGEVFGELSVLYDNTASRSRAGGDYKNYLRLILQPDADLSSITIDNVRQSIVKAITDPEIYESKKFTSPSGLEIDKTQEKGKTVYGFLVNVPSGKRQVITVKYSLSKKTSLKEHLLFYNLRFFKQPGTDEYPFEFSLSYPLNYHPIKISKDFREKDGKVSLLKTLNSDYDILISLVKQ